MPDDSVLTFAVVAEAAIDQKTACELADRVLCHETEWLEPGLLDSVRASVMLDAYVELGDIVRATRPGQVLQRAYAAELVEGKRKPTELVAVDALVFIL